MLFEWQFWVGVFGLVLVAGAAFYGGYLVGGVQSVKRIQLRAGDKELFILQQTFVQPMGAQTMQDMVQLSVESMVPSIASAADVTPLPTLDIHGKRRYVVSVWCAMQRRKENTGLDAKVLLQQRPS